MLVVSFHGGATGINNLAAYETPSGALLTDTALAEPATVPLSELRGLTVENNQLYVANGAKATSQVLCYGLPDSAGACAFVSLVIGPTVTNSKGHFETCVAHPFGIAFNGPDACFVSNQDTNTVALVTITGNSGSLGGGSQSAYLTETFPAGVFLDGTFVASQQGALHGVKIAAQDVPQTDGGLGVSTKPDGGKILNSVRDVAVANGILFVADEVDATINMYALADGTFLGASARLGKSPTHLSIAGDGLYVSAGSSLLWSALPSSAGGPRLSLEPIQVSVPAGNKIGGISFNGDTVYVPFQTGTGGVNPGGSIDSFTVSTSAPPAFSNQATLVSGLTDTPEFVLFVE